MKIHTFGDSHAKETFKDISSDIHIHWLGPLTMKRVGDLRDDTLTKQKFNPNDINIFCFGEIDVRCHVKIQAQNGKTVDDVINEMVTSYVNKIASIRDKCSSESFCIMSVPPCRGHLYQNKTGMGSFLDLAGSDEERASYALKMNQLIESLCTKNNLMFFNMYERYKDHEGMLTFELSDGSVHIRDRKFIIEMLQHLNWISLNKE